MMAPAITRLDGQRMRGFDRHTVGPSTPAGALTSDVCPSWAPASATTRTLVGVAVQRDRTQVQQFETTANDRIAKDVEYRPLQQSQSKFGAGSEGGGRGTS
jgi:hypothetical protein